MNNQRQEMDMGFTQEVIPECHHLCLIYDSEEERQKIVSEYLAAGLKRGEIVRYFADTTAPDDIYAWLSELGLEPRRMTPSVSSKLRVPTVRVEALYLNR